MDARHVGLINKVFLALTFYAWGPKDHAVIQKFLS